VTIVPPALRSVALLALANSAGDAALVPLVPAIRADLRLDGIEVGVLFAATTLAVLVASVPAGQFAARFGARRLLLGASVLAPTALALMAAAPSLGVLLAGRIAFGVAFAVFWSVAPAVAAARQPGASGSGAVIAFSGAGWLAGPLLAGLLADLAGWRLPLVVIAVLSAPVALGFARGEETDTVARPVPMRSTLTLLLSTPTVAWSAATAALLGFVTGTIGVLVPTVLAANGVTASGIGVAVALASVVWVASGFVAARLGGARIRVRFVGAAVAALALCWAVPVVSLSSAAVVGFLVVAAACRALLGALLYPLAAASTAGESETASLTGVFNLAWALPALVAPVLAGAAVEQGAVRAAFALVCGVVAIVALGMLVPGRRVATA
jgi:MFS family permease